MQTLGISDKPQGSENFFKRLFWPGDNASDADTLGTQGFWVCFVIAVSSCVVLCFQGHWLIGLLTLTVFLLGGIGVREHSTAAAVIVAGLYILNVVAMLFMKQFPGVLTFFVILLLLANIRGTHIAAKWQNLGDPDELPTRFNDSLKDKMVDQMPARVWPTGRFVFFVLAAIYLVMSMLGTMLIAAHLVRGVQR